MPMTPSLPPGAFDVVDARDLERFAVAFAAMDAQVADSQLDSLAAQAIARWRLADATTWQRVKFRARLIRAAHRSPSARKP